MPTTTTKRPASRAPTTTKKAARPAGPGATASAGAPAAPPPEAVAFEASSGNVFADLGLPNAADRLAKAELARILRGVVRERRARDGWTQARAAKALGIPASDMSDLMRGKLARFSQERLEHFLTRLDMAVRIQVGPRPAGTAHAQVTVERVAAFG